MKLLYILAEAIKSQFSKLDVIKDEEDEILRVSKELGVSPYEISVALLSGNKKPLTDDIWSRLENTDSYDISSEEDFVSLSKQYNKDYKSIMAVKDLSELPPALILEYEPGKYHLVGGNTRLMYFRLRGETPEVIIGKLDNSSTPSE
jgi:hypothetical protein